MGDVVYGIRTLIKNPGFTVTAVLSLALGIGANVAIFSVLHAVILQPLPYKEADRMITIWNHNEATSNQRARSTMGPPVEQYKYASISYLDYLDWKEQAPSLGESAVYGLVRRYLSGADRPRQLQGVQVSEDFFHVLGVPPLMGQPGQEEDTAVLSYALWQDSFGADPDIVGKRILLDDRPHTVTAVMPAQFDFPAGAHVWMPLHFAKPPRRWVQWYQAFARLQPGATVEQAQAELTAVSARLEELYPDSHEGRKVVVVPFIEELAGRTRPAVLVLFGAVGLVLLIACANVAGLLLGRGAGRTREFAIRQAVGAGSWRLVRQLLTESLLLSAAGGAAGLVLAIWILDAAQTLVPADMFRHEAIGMDWPVLGYALAVSVVAGLFFGLFPALQSIRAPVRGSRSRLRDLLVSAELAVSLALLIGAGLMTSTLWRLQSVNKGFRTENVVTAHVALPNHRYAGPEITRFSNELLEGLRGLPGVLSAGAVDRLPLGGGITGTKYEIEGKPAYAHYRRATTDYFETLRIPLIVGRLFNHRDTADSQPVAILNRTMAEHYWPSEQAIGKRVQLVGVEAPREIIGVVEDVRHNRLHYESGFEMYVPFAQEPVPYMNVMVRANAPPEAVLTAIQREVWKIDKDQPIRNPRTLQAVVDASEGIRTFQGKLLIAFSAVAFCLALVGVYGVISHAVVRRTHEIGIRMAIGAERWDVLGLVLSQGLRLAITGAVGGLVIALATTRVLSSQLYGVTPTDPFTYASVSAALVLTAAVASYIPARRAARVDPVTALRYE